jgi:hypothetical protein
VPEVDSGSSQGDNGSPEVSGVPSEASPNAPDVETGPASPSNASPDASNGSLNASTGSPATFRQLAGRGNRAGSPIQHLTECIQRPVGCVNRTIRRFRQLTRRGNLIGFSVRRLAECVQLSIGCITRLIGSFRRLTQRGNRPISPSNASPDASNEPLDASPGRQIDPATRRTRPIAGFSIRRFAGCV